MKIILLLAAGSIERLNDATTGFEKGLHVPVDIKWPPVLTETEFITQMISDDEEVAKACVSHFMIQRLLDSLDNYQTKSNDQVASYCRIPIQFEVKPEFDKRAVAVE